MALGALALILSRSVNHVDLTALTNVQRISECRLVERISAHTHPVRGSSKFLEFTGSEVNSQLFCAFKENALCNRMKALWTPLSWAALTIGLHNGSLSKDAIFKYYKGAKISQKPKKFLKMSENLSTAHASLNANTCSLKINVRVRAAIKISCYLTEHTKALGMCAMHFRT